MDFERFLSLVKAILSIVLSFLRSSRGASFSSASARRADCFSHEATALLSFLSCSALRPFLSTGEIDSASRIFSLKLLSSTVSSVSVVTSSLTSSFLAGVVSSSAVASVSVVTSGVIVPSISFVTWPSYHSFSWLPICSPFSEISVILYLVRPEYSDFVKSLLAIEFIFFLNSWSSFVLSNPLISFPILKATVNASVLPTPSFRRTPLSCHIK